MSCILFDEGNIDLSQIIFYMYGLRFSYLMAVRVLRCPLLRTELHLVLHAKDCHQSHIESGLPLRGGDHVRYELPLDDAPLHLHSLRPLQSLVAHAAELLRSCLCLYCSGRQTLWRFQYYSTIRLIWKELQVPVFPCSRLEVYFRLLSA